ncbi:MAG: hypothetical protein ACMXYF_02480 [Candidatus Woesearchaeota archaeon]
MILEDEIITITAAKKAYNDAHIQIAIKEESEAAFTHAMNFAHMIAKLFFDSGYQGTNILLQSLTQIDIVGRKENDGLSFNWEVQQGDPAQVKDIASQIKSALVFSEPKKETIAPKPEVTQEEPKPEEKQTLLDWQLKRVP